MNKYLVIILFAIGLTSCNQRNEQYYLSNPNELQKAIKACPNEHPEQLSCQDIEKIANRMSTLSHELQSGPQAFGNKILALQQTITTQEVEFKKNLEKKDLKTSIDNNQYDLAYYLAVVKWLESPES